MNQAIEEEEPLLADEPADSHDHSAPPNADFAVILYFMAIHFLLAFCEMVLVAPLIKLFENSLCVTHFGFPSGGVEESLCKIPDIQSPLATIRGWKSMFDTLPVLLVAIPVGRLGDKFCSRKIILAAALIGVAASLCEIFAVCAFPQVFSLRLVWLSSVFLLCGGGLNAAASYMWAMSAEAIPTSRRSHAFYYIFSAFYVAELLGSFIASVTIDISPWIPCGLAMGSVILCLILIFVMPDLRLSARSLRSPKLDDEGGPLDVLVNRSFDHLVSVFSNRNTLLVIPVFLVGILRYTTLNVLIQYASVQFGMRLGAAAVVYSWTAIVNIALFLFIIPPLTTYIRQKYNIRPQSVDLFLVRSGLGLLCVGCVCIGLAPSSTILPIGVIIFASGFGSRVSALSLISYWISDDIKATVYASITVLESIGHTIGDPSMQQIFAASLRLPYFWHALPFFVAAALYFLAGISTVCMQIEKDSKDSDSAGELANESQEDITS